MNINMSTAKNVRAGTNTQSRTRIRTFRILFTFNHSFIGGLIDWLVG